MTDRLQKELQQNVALRVDLGQIPEEFNVSGRGLMHLGILLENMRREGYEICVTKPNVILRKVEGRRYEPMLGAIPQRKAGVMIAMAMAQLVLELD